MERDTQVMPSAWDPAPVPEGRSTPRREDKRLVTGRDRYVASLQADGMLHAAFARSTVAHGELTGVHVDEAREAPGVVAAFAAGDLALNDIPGSMPPGPEAPEMGRPPLASDRVRYSGEPVAVVVAESPYLAADAVEFVDFDVEPLPTVATPDEALTDQFLLFPQAGSNVVGRAVGPEGADVSLDRWPVQAEVIVENQRLAPVPIEPLGVLAVPEGDRVIVWCGHQRPHGLRNLLAQLLDLPEERVTVRVPDVGGGFGLRGRFFPEYAVVTAAALRLGRPVRWIQTRSEQFTGGTHGRGMRHRVRLAGDESGRVQAARLDVLADIGAYPFDGTLVPRNAILLASGAYDIPAVEVTTTLVVTNRAPIGSYRGAGRPEATMAIERGIDEFAVRAGMDPAEVRRRNFIPAESLPHRTPTGALYDSGDYARSLAMALDLVDADGVRAEQARRRGSRGAPLGLGVGVFIERAGGALGSGEYARVSVDGSGEVVVRAGTAATGQGHETTWAQIAGAVFAVDSDSVRVLTGDTDEVAQGWGSVGSRSTQLAGSAIYRMSVEVVRQARELAARMLEASVDDITLDGGGFAVRGDASTRLTLAQLAEGAGEHGVALDAEEMYSPGAQTFPYGTVAAVVEVDVDTGKITIERLVAVDDCGTVIHPQIVEGQVHGSLAQGIAQALYEGVEYDDDGQLTTATLVDYLVPGAPDIPPVETGRLVTPAPSNPLGAKGTGESGCIGAPPAIVNAALDALRPLGVVNLQMPLTPERVWRSIQVAREPAGAAPQAR